MARIGETDPLFERVKETRDALECELRACLAEAGLRSTADFMNRLDEYVVASVRAHKTMRFG